MFERCTTCHREGGSSFALTTYEEARPWAKAIKEEVNERRMPPWGAVKGFGEFRDDQGLTQEQIELINDWVEGGAPEGDPALLPKASSKPPAAIAPPAPVSYAEAIVDGRLVLKTPLKLEGIRPNNVPEGASLQVVAELPDGSIEPLLWLYNYKPKFEHPYFYAQPMSLPAGTKIEITPVSAGTVALITGLRQEAGRTSAGPAPGGSGARLVERTGDGADSKARVGAVRQAGISPLSGDLRSAFVQSAAQSALPESGGPLGTNAAHCDSYRRTAQARSARASGLSASESNIVLGTSIRYDIAEVVDPQVHIEAKVKKAVLATLR